MPRPFRRLDAVSTLALAISTWTFVLLFLLRPDILHWSIAVSLGCMLFVLGVNESRHRLAKHARSSRADAAIRIGSDGHGRAVVLTRTDLVHARITGTTGAGKTELLMRIADQEICAGRGMTFVDGKGDVATVAQLAALVSRHGRDDDLTVLDFVTGRSHRSIDPFEGLTGAAVAAILCPEEGERDPLRLFAATCHDVRSFGGHLPGRDGAHIDLARVVEAARHGSKAAETYLGSIAGYDAGRGQDQRSDIMEEHARMTADLRSRLSRLFEIGGPAFDDRVPRVDLARLVPAGRIVVALLPPGKKGEESASILERVVERQLARCPRRPGRKGQGLLLLDSVDPAFGRDWIDGMGSGFVEVSRDLGRRSPSWIGCDLLMQNQFDPELGRLRCGEAILVTNGGSRKFMVEKSSVADRRFDLSGFMERLARPIVLKETMR